MDSEVSESKRKRRKLEVQGLNDVGQEGEKQANDEIPEDLAQQLQSGEWLSDVSNDDAAAYDEEDSLFATVFKKPERKKKRVKIVDAKKSEDAPPSSSKTEEKVVQLTPAEKLEKQRAAMRKIVEDARDQSQSSIARSERRKKSFARITKDTTEALVQTIKKNYQKKTVLDKMESNATQTGPMGVLYNSVKHGYRVKVWIRRYNGLRGILTGYLVAFDFHMNLAMIDVTEIFTIETWMLGDPVSKKKKKKRKPTILNVNDLKAETTSNTENLKNPDPIKAKKNLYPKNAVVKKPNKRLSLQTTTPKTDDSTKKPQGSKSQLIDNISPDVWSSLQSMFSQNEVPSPSLQIDNNNTITSPDAPKDSSSVMVDSMISLLRGRENKLSDSPSFTSIKTAATGVETKNSASVSKLSSTAKTSLQNTTSSVTSTNSKTQNLNKEQLFKTLKTISNTITEADNISKTTLLKNNKQKERKNSLRENSPESPPLPKHGPTPVNVFTARHSLKPSPVVFQKSRRKDNELVGKKEEKQTKETQDTKQAKLKIVDSKIKDMIKTHGPKYSPEQKDTKQSDKRVAEGEEKQAVKTPQLNETQTSVTVANLEETKTTSKLDIQALRLAALQIFKVESKKFNSSLNIKDVSIEQNTAQTKNEYIKAKDSSAASLRPSDPRKQRRLVTTNSENSAESNKDEAPDISNEKIKDGLDATEASVSKNCDKSQKTEWAPPTVSQDTENPNMKLIQSVAENGKSDLNLFTTLHKQSLLVDPRLMAKEKPQKNVIDLHLTNICFNKIPNSKSGRPSVESRAKKKNKSSCASNRASNTVDTLEKVGSVSSESLLCNIARENKGEPPLLVQQASFAVPNPAARVNIKDRQPEITLTENPLTTQQYPTKEAITLQQQPLSTTSGVTLLQVSASTTTTAETLSPSSSFSKKIQQPKHDGTKCQSDIHNSKSLDSSKSLSKQTRPSKGKRCSLHTSLSCNMVRDIHLDALITYTKGISERLKQNTASNDGFAGQLVKNTWLLKNEKIVLKVKNTEDVTFKKSTDSENTTTVSQNSLSANNNMLSLCETKQSLTSQNPSESPQTQSIVKNVTSDGLQKNVSSTTSPENYEHVMQNKDTQVNNEDHNTDSKQMDPSANTKKARTKHCRFVLHSVGSRLTSAHKLRTNEKRIKSEITKVTPWFEDTTLKNELSTSEDEWMNRMHVEELIENEDRRLKRRKTKKRKNRRVRIIESPQTSDDAMSVNEKPIKQPLKNLEDVFESKDFVENSSDKTECVSISIDEGMLVDKEALRSKILNNEKNEFQDNTSKTSNKCSKTDESTFTNKLEKQDRVLKSSDDAMSVDEDSKINKSLQKLSNIYFEKQEAAPKSSENESKKGKSNVEEKNSITKYDKMGEHFSIPDFALAHGDQQKKRMLIDEIDKTQIVEQVNSECIEKPLSDEKGIKKGENDKPNTAVVTSFALKDVSGKINSSEQSGFSENVNVNFNNSSKEGERNQQAKFLENLDLERVHIIKSIYPSDSGKVEVKSQNTVCKINFKQESVGGNLDEITKIDCLNILKTEESDSQKVQNEKIPQTGCSIDTKDTKPTPLDQLSESTSIVKIETSHDQNENCKYEIEKPVETKNENNDIITKDKKADSVSIKSEISKDEIAIVADKEDGEISSSENEKVEKPEKIHKKKKKSSKEKKHRKREKDKTESKTRGKKESRHRDKRSEEKEYSKKTWKISEEPKKDTSEDRKLKHRDKYSEQKQSEKTLEKDHADKKVSKELSTENNASSSQILDLRKLLEKKKVKESTTKPEQHLRSEYERTKRSDRDHELSKSRRDGRHEITKYERQRKPSCTDLKSKNVENKEKSQRSEKSRNDKSDSKLKKSNSESAYKDEKQKPIEESRNSEIHENKDDYKLSENKTSASRNEREKSDKDKNISHSERTHTSRDRNKKKESHSSVEDLKGEELSKQKHRDRDAKKYDNALSDKENAKTEREKDIGESSEKNDKRRSRWSKKEESDPKTAECKDSERRKQTKRKLSDREDSKPPRTPMRSPLKSRHLQNKRKVASPSKPGVSFMERRKNRKVEVSREEQLLRSARGEPYTPQNPQLGLVYRKRHANQLFVRGDNIVMVAYDTP